MSFRPAIEEKMARPGLSPGFISFPSVNEGGFLAADFPKQQRCSEEELSIRNSKG